MGGVIIDGRVLARTPRWVWWIGLPADFWLTEIPGIEKAIEKLKLKPVSKEHAASFATMSIPEEGESRPLALRKPHFPGGIRVAHLHFRDDLFLLNEEQWKEFSGQMLRDFQKKLGSVKSVNFEQFIEVSEAINSLA